MAVPRTYIARKEPVKFMRLFHLDIKGNRTNFITSQQLFQVVSEPAVFRYFVALLAFGAEVVNEPMLQKLPLFDSLDLVDYRVCESPLVS